LTWSYYGLTILAAFFLSGQWDDDTLYGERRFYLLKYQLQNNKLELTEMDEGGSMGARLLAARQVPKAGTGGTGCLLIVQPINSTAY
jgi:hypothetical protein